jgi:hypothetical protein
MQQSAEQAGDTLAAEGYSALCSALCSDACFSAVFASGLMNGGSGWSWGREPPLCPFLQCLPRVLLTPFSWVMLDTSWFPLPLLMPALGKPNQKNQYNASIISQRGAWH